MFDKDQVPFFESAALLERLRPELPNYMVPHAIYWRTSLPRNANGKLDRRLLANEYADLYKVENTL